MPSWIKTRALLRGAGFLLITLFLALIYPLAIAAGQKARCQVRRFWCRSSCWLFNITVRCEGRPFGCCPTLFVSNHVSYLDVIILGSFLDATFIAKAEIKGWPLIGYIANRVGTMFIRRHWRQALVQRNLLAARMRQGESFVLFAEGTSTSGLAVKPFKTSLLSVAEPWVLDCPVAARAVTLAYTRLADGRAYDRATCDLYAWYDDMEFAPHLRRLLQQDGCEVTIRLHEPVLSWAVDSRKILGPQLRGQIVESLARARDRAWVSFDPELDAGNAVSPANS